MPRADTTPGRLLGTLPCACGACRRVATERVYVGDDLADALVDALDGRPALLLGDPRTLAACGDDLAAWLSAAGACGTVADLEPSGTRLHADDADVERTVRVLEGTPDAVPVADGTGTVNDLVKAAAQRLGRPYLCVATAASMNG